MTWLIIKQIVSTLKMTWIIIKQSSIVYGMEIEKVAYMSRKLRKFPWYEVAQLHLVTLGLQNFLEKEL